MPLSENLLRFPPQHFAIIVNEKARNAEKVESYLSQLKEAGFLFQFFSVSPDSLEKVIKQCQSEYKLVLIGGGDGTLRSAAQYLANSDTIMGVLPLGTMNHFAKEMKLALSIDELVNVLRSPAVKKIDLAQVNDYVFINNSSVGFYPRFARKRDLYAKRLNKWLGYIPSLFHTLRTHKTYHMHITGKEINLRLKSSFVMISNNCYRWEFPVNFGRESFNDHKLGLYYLKHGKIEIAKLFDIIMGRNNHFVATCSLFPLDVTIEKYKEVIVSLDGDAIKMSLPLKYKLLPDSLNLLVAS
ncbi:Diacylglycerol kinase [Legionella birminghamensis]|uniref:Diacylglycerol kinase n=1 Tax=Legionella birminghamensis TaxID=28083 RepID=A0A378IAP6_9GAMM|nr:diacylglycerol kinase family protein [Legionella birminghamensis]KTC75214.1 Diacylglycerol kinase [Legionella birminghamensis]STX31835.1 Diacylglycerol kinase [Legionella birminghamensis]